MHQLPSGRHIVLTIEPLLEKTKSTSYQEYRALKNTIANFESFSADVSLVELRSQDGVSCSINGGKLGYFCCGDINIKLEDIPCSIEGAEPDQVFCYTGLTIKAIGTDRSRHRQWSDDDIEAFKAWVLEEPAQQWLRKAYTEFAAVFSKTSEPARPVDCLLDDDHPAIFNNGCAQEELPDSVIKLIGELIKRDNVQSVSCPFNNSKVWRLLVAEQTRRAQQTGKSQQEAFTLAGPDGGFGFDPREWGGEVHVPYEGAWPQSKTSMAKLKIILAKCTCSDAVLNKMKNKLHSGFSKPQNRGMRMLNLILARCIRKVLVSNKMMRWLRTGFVKSIEKFMGMTAKMVSGI